MALIGVKVARICVNVAWISGEMVPGVCLACQELTGTLHSHVDVGVAFSRLVEARGELSLCDKAPLKCNMNQSQRVCVWGDCVAGRGVQRRRRGMEESNMNHDYNALFLNF